MGFLTKVTSHHCIMCTHTFEILSQIVDALDQHDKAIVYI